MFYELEVQDHIRVPPQYFNMELKDAALKCLSEQLEGQISRKLGIVVCVVGVSSIGEGILIPGDGAAYYEIGFNVISFKPEMQELLNGVVSEITDFGAFMNIGPVDGMIHISQTMEDYVSFSESKVLTGKETKKTLKVGDLCRARIVAISFKEANNPRIGLTMRQPHLGSLKWVKDEGEKQKKAAPKEAKEAKEGKGK